MKDQAAAAVPHYLRDLDPEQRAAALALEGPILVLAGAGSGKTRTLVHRIVHLIESGVQPRRILAVTFTNRAADEMRERVAQVAGRRARAVTLSTFHSLGARILREHGALIDLPERFAIYSTGDQIALVRRIMSEEVHVAATVGDETYDVRRVIAQLSSWKNRLIDPEEARREVAEGRTRANRSDDYAILAADVYPRYQESLRAAGACDFDDLLIRPVELLRGHAEAREAVWRRWHYLMVDEYQDTNSVQLEMARLLAGPRKNLCVVGDDDQSIYAWRGADLRNILDFERHFGGATVITLDRNYRSTQRILSAANTLIANNTERKSKWMRTDNGPGPKIDYWEFDPEPGRTAEECEAAMIAREIGIRRFHEKLGWSDFAVLYRANHQARPLEEALRQANIPYRVVGGTSYFDRKEIADAAAYLRFLVNPRDDLALRRIINFPTRGIGRTTLIRLVEAARAKRLPLGHLLPTGHEVEGLNSGQLAAVDAFSAFVERWRTSLANTESGVVGGRAGDESLGAFADDLFREVRLEEAIRSEAGGERSAEIRIDNLREFVASIHAYERRTWAAAPLPDEEADWAPPSMAGFLQNISLVNESEASEEAADSGADMVTLLTLHSAKGLEFAHVFLVGLEEEILPHARSVQEAGTGSTGDPIAEERRLLYVGITRARHRLTLSGCRSRRRGTELIPRQPSRFLAEMPADVLQHHSSPVTSSLSEEDRKEFKQNFFAQMREMLQ